MDIFKRLNDAVCCLEEQLCDEIDITKVSKAALSSPEAFSRLFSYLTGMTLREYIRCRRLTLAAFELRGTEIKVIDAALKYGYNSADAFTKAFALQHGISPSEARDRRTSLKIYPPVSFHILIKGAREMNFRIVETEAVVLKGLSKKFTGSAAARFEQEHIFWSDQHDNAPLCVGRGIPGIWYGIWSNGIYQIARSASDAETQGLENIVIPAGKYAVFTTKKGGFAGYELPRLRELVFDSWLEASGYKQTADLEIEVYHLYSKDERSKRYYELWVPVLEK